jgi:DHA1 family tetracycline resistance protein-like MFS transporter
MFLLVGMSAVFAQAVLLRPLNHCIGERLVVIVCFIAATISNSMYGIAGNKKQLYMGVCVGALSGMAFPTISAIKANNVGMSEQGRIQGALFSIQAVSAGFGPITMRSVDAFAKRSGFSLGTMFFFAAFLQFVALCCACHLPKDKANSKKIDETNNTNNNNEQ